MRVAIATGGGDAPGLNAAVEGAVRAGGRLRWSMCGVLDGLDGLLFPGRYPSGGVVDLGPAQVRGIGRQGGTILGAANDSAPLTVGLDGVVEQLREARVDALVCVGGDGTQEIAAALGAMGVWVVGVPKTIDRDLLGSEATLGFETAVDLVVTSLDRLRTTADAHRKVFVVEVMGRDAGWLALHAGVAGDADVICVPEIPYDPVVVGAALVEILASGRRSALAVIGEGAHPLGGEPSVTSRRTDGKAILGGAGAALADMLRQRFALPVRSLTLGHLQRGGDPVAIDRLHGLRLGAAAIATITAGRRRVLVGWDGARVTEVSLDHVAGRTRRVTDDDPTLRTAEQLGINLGR